MTFSLKDKEDETESVNSRVCGNKFLYKMNQSYVELLKSRIS